VRLQTHGLRIAGVQNDLLFPSAAPIAADTDGQPACTVNPAINKRSTAFAFQGSGCPGDRSQCTGIRALVVAIDNLGVIPNGAVLYTCEVTLLEAAPGTALPFQSVNVYASDPFGANVRAAGGEGTLTVTAQSVPAGASDPQTATGGSNGGCAISPAGKGSPNGWLLAGAAMLAMRLLPRRRDKGRSVQRLPGREPANTKCGRPA
jgi:hypothetical protein